MCPSGRGRFHLKYRQSLNYHGRLSGKDDTTTDGSSSADRPWRTSVHRSHPPARARVRKKKTSGALGGNIDHLIHPSRVQPGPRQASTSLDGPFRTWLASTMPCSRLINQGIQGPWKLMCVLNSVPIRPAANGRPRPGLCETRVVDGVCVPCWRNGMHAMYMLCPGRTALGFPDVFSEGRADRPMEDCGW